MSHPFFPLYTKDFFSDYRIQDLSAEQRGLWLLLLARMWEADMMLPADDDKMIARMMGLPCEKWIALREACTEAGLLHIDGGFLISQRLAKEHSIVVKKIELATKAGKASALKRTGETT